MNCNWGILGPGFVATRAVIPALQQVSEARLKAVASRDPAKAQAVAHQFEIERHYQDYQDLLNDPEVDAVYIALPNHLHHPWTIKALRAGKHVLCEKPLATSAREGEEMLAVSQETGKLLMEAVMYRFHPRIRYLKGLIAESELGELRFLRSSFTFTLQDPETYRNRSEYGGGALLDVGVYCLNALDLFTTSGQEPEQVTATALYQAETGIDLGVEANLRYGEHMLAQIQCSFEAAEYQSIELIGSLATVSVPHPAFTAWKEDRTTLLIQKDNVIKQKIFLPANPYKTMVEHFTNCVLARRPVAISPTESVQTLRLLDRVREALR